MPRVSWFVATATLAAALAGPAAAQPGRGNQSVTIRPGESCPAGMTSSFARPAMRRTRSM